MLTKTRATQSIPIDIQSLVESHQQPFVVIDRDYRIIAVNAAYERTYGSTAAEAIGQFCYRISHDNDVPCCKSGEDCPHEHMFKDGKPHSCVHIHYDKDHRMHQVRVTGHPLRSADGELYMGELIQEISMPESAQPVDKRMVGQAPLFTACLEQLKLVAASYAPVLL
ncbi:MAG: PAS domain-containing protein, partial [Gammaproteobacteria bacterium]